MARIAYLADQVMHTIGLHERASCRCCWVSAAMSRGSGKSHYRIPPCSGADHFVGALVPCTARMAVIAVLTPSSLGEGRPGSLGDWLPLTCWQFLWWVFCCTDYSSAVSRWLSLWNCRSTICPMPARWLCMSGATSSLFCKKRGRLS